MNIPQKKQSERGVSLIAFTLMLAFVVIPIMGLGIDAAVQYWISARLNSAVDSAVLAAGRSLSIGGSLATQTSNAQTVGEQYFAANFPPGTLGTTVYGGAQVSDSVSISVTPGVNVVTVSGLVTVHAPLYFMRMLHLSSGNIAVSSQSTRRNTNVILVLDRSGSMNNASNSCAALVGAVETFTNRFIDGRDQIGMITFSTSANVDYAPTLYFDSGSPSLNSVLNQLVCVGATSSPQALYLAYQQMQKLNAPGALNVILFFTDGNANNIVADYPVKTQSDTRYDPVSTNSLTTINKSNCSSTGTLLGGFLAYANTPGTTGYTGGVVDETPVAISAGNPAPSAINASGCTFSQPGVFGNNNVPTGRVDVAYIPLHDHNGNNTTGFEPVDTFPAGDTYAGQIRPDDPQTIRYAATNATDSVAQKIRSDALNIVTYTIGLTGNENLPMNYDFMERVANDPRASNYNSGQPQGMFVLATDNASLSDAFNAIAAQILRLSR